MQFEIGQEKERAAALLGAALFKTRGAAQTSGRNVLHPSGGQLRVRAVTGGHKSSQVSCHRGSMSVTAITGVTCNLKLTAT